ncbi:MAG: 4Fe-4S dicluster domain-containing protein [Planctomycetes bacterium]|nr:4Fe-4S dicluster domain-containing protein [Planctomycetota bacterium]
MTPEGKAASAPPLPLSGDAQSRWEEADLQREVRRVFGICESCRMCVGYCGSFPAIFEAVDRHGDAVADVGKLTPAEVDRSVDLCFQCKLCHVKCPYTPPHAWAVDFPRLMLRARAVRAHERGVSLQDRFLGDPDRVGRLGCAAAPLSNWVARLRPHRWLMEKLLGVHRDRQLPEFASETFEAWFRRRGPSRPRGPVQGRVALFATCTVNYNRPSIGRAAVEVFERNRLEVALPPQRCCGMPAMDGGDVEGARGRALFNLASFRPWVEKGYDIAVLGPTCGMVWKTEYPRLAGEGQWAPPRDRVADGSEVLARLLGSGGLDTAFRRPLGRIAYHVPCHLRAQNAGQPAAALLRAVPGTTVESVERCSGMDGTWGMKVEHFEESCQRARPLVEELTAGRPDRLVGDCPLAALQVRQACGRAVEHPLEVLREAYGDA